MKLDELLKQIKPYVLSWITGAPGGVGAPVGAPFVTIGNDATLTQERALTHDATLTHTDGGANGSYTLGVVANGHRHIEENIDETTYLVVDAGGRGDYTTLSAACTYINANPGHWTVLIRNGTYQENYPLSVDTAVPCTVTFIGLGKVIVQSTLNYGATVSTGSNVIATYRNLTLKTTSGDVHNGNVPVAAGGNGSTSIFDQCEFICHYGPAFLSAGTFICYDCPIYHDAPTTTADSGSYANLIGYSAANNAYYYLYNCVMTANIGTTPFTEGGHAIFIGAGTTCEIHGGRIITNAGDAIYNSAGTVSVARVAYDTTATTGTITVLDGDSPLPVGGITPAMLANASAQYKYLVSGATPFAYAESAGALNIASGKTLAATETITLAASSAGLTATVPESLTMAGRNVDNSFTADNYYTGSGSGIPYGSFYGNDINWSQASAVQNTWYEISDADIVDGGGGLNLITHDGSGKLTVAKAGRYAIAYNLVVSSSIAGKQLQSGISINGTEVNDGLDHETTGAISAQKKMGSHAILALAANDTIEISLRTTDTGTPDISVEHINVVVMQVGG